VCVCKIGKFQKYSDASFNGRDVKVYWSNSDICHLFVTSRKFYVQSKICIFQAFVRIRWALTYFIPEQNAPAVDILTCQTYSSMRRVKKKRGPFRHISVAFRKIRSGQRKKWRRRFHLRRPMNVRYWWVNQKGHITPPPAPVFHQPIRIIGWDEKCVDGAVRHLKNEPSDDDPVYWSLQIALAEGKGARAEDYPFYIMPLILLFMNLTSLRGRGGRSFCFRTRGRVPWQ